MADYYPVLSRAIEALENNTAENRRSVYERARGAIVRQLRGYDPPLSESEITRERLALEEAVRRIEQEVRERAQPERTPSPPPVPAAAAAVSAPQAAPAPRSGEGSFVRQHSVAADAAALGAATAQGHAAEAPVSPREPERPRIEPRVDPNSSYREPEIPPPFQAQEPPVPPYLDQRPQMPQADDAPDSGRPRSRGPAIGAIAVVVLLIGAGIGAYLARDEIGGMLGSEPQTTDTAATDGDTSAPKITDRVGDPPAEPETSTAEPEEPAEPETATAPATPTGETQAPGQTVAPVSQRAVLYEEAPDRQGGSAYNGQVEWRTEPVANAAGETQLRADIRVPERNIAVSLIFRRNTDQTLPASHTIDIQFTLPADFENAGVANVPGILFKPTEDAGGTALAGLSVRVMNNFFLIGLSSADADQASNLQAIREQPWIDLPILYENGRRAVLTIEKGTPGDQAFQAAFAAWNGAPAGEQQQN